MEIPVKNELRDLLDSHLAAQADIGDLTITLPVNGAQIPANCILTITAGRDAESLAQAESVEVEAVGGGVFTVIRSYLNGVESSAIQANWPAMTEVVLFFNQMYYDSLKDAINGLIEDPHAVEESWEFKKGIVVSGESADTDGAIRYRNGKLQGRQNGVWSDVLTSSLPTSLYQNGMVYFDPLTRWTASDQIRVKHNPLITGAPALDANGEISIKSKVSLWHGTTRFSIAASETQVAINANTEIVITNTLVRIANDLQATTVSADAVETSSIVGEALEIEATSIDLTTPAFAINEDVSLEAHGPLTAREFALSGKYFEDRTAYLAFVAGLSANAPVNTEPSLSLIKDPEATIPDMTFLDFTGTMGVSDEMALLGYGIGYIRASVLSETADNLILKATKSLLLKGGSTNYLQINPAAPGEKLIFNQPTSALSYMRIGQHIIVNECDGTPEEGAFQWSAANGFQGYHDGEWVDFQTAASNLPSSSPGYTLRWQDHDWRGTALFQVHDDQIILQRSAYISGTVKVQDLQESEEAQLGMVRYNGDFQGFMPVLNSQGEYENYWVSLSGGGITSGGANGEMLVYSAESERWVSAGEYLVFDDGEMYMEARLRGLVGLAVPPQAALPEDDLTGRDQRWLQDNPYADWPGEDAQIPGPAPDGANWMQIVPASGSFTQDQIRVWGVINTRTISRTNGQDELGDPIIETADIPEYGWLLLNADSDLGSLTLPNPASQNGKMLIVRNNLYAWTTAFIIDEGNSITTMLEFAASNTNINGTLEVQDDLTLQSNVRLTDEEAYIGLGSYSAGRTGDNQPEDLLWKIERILPIADDSLTENDEDSFDNKDLAFFYHKTGREEQFDPDVEAFTDLLLTINGHIYTASSTGLPGSITITPSTQTPIIEDTIAYAGLVPFATISVAVQAGVGTLQAIKYYKRAIALRLTRDGDAYLGRDAYIERNLHLAGPIAVGPQDPLESPELGSIAYNGDFEGWIGDRWVSLTRRLAAPQIPLPFVELGSIVTINGTDYTIADVPSANTIELTSSISASAGTVVSFANGAEASLTQAVSSSDTLILSKPITLLPTDLTIDNSDYEVTQQDGFFLYFTTNPELSRDDLITFSSGATVRIVRDYSENTGQIEFRYIEVPGTTISYDALRGWYFTDALTIENNTAIFKEAIKLGPTAQTPQAGMIRYDGDFQGYTGESWVSLSGNGTQGIAVTEAGSMLVSNGTIWIGTPKVSFNSLGILKINSVMQLEEWTGNEIPEENLVRGMVRHRGDLEYFTGNSWISLTDYYGLPGGHLPTQAVDEEWQDGAIITYNSTLNVWEYSEDILVTDKINLAKDTEIAGTIKLGAGVDDAGKIRFTGTDLECYINGWVTLTGGLSIVGSEGNGLFYHEGAWQATNLISIDETSLTVVGDLAANSLTLGDWLIDLNAENLLIGDHITIAPNMVTLPSLTLSGTLSGGTAILGIVDVLDLEASGELAGASLAISGNSVLNTAVIGTLSGGNETHNALEVNGLAKFASTVVVGDQLSEAPEVGMIRFHSGDFQGWDGEFWHSMTGKLQGAENIFGTGYADGTIFRYVAALEEWQADESFRVTAGGIYIETNFTFTPDDDLSRLSLINNTRSSLAFSTESALIWELTSDGIDLQIVEGTTPRVTVPAGGGLVVHDGVTQVQDLLVLGSIIGASSSSANFYLADVGTRSNRDYSGSDAEVIVGSNEVYRAFRFPTSGYNPVYFNALMPASYNKNTLRITCYLKALNGAQDKQVQIRGRAVAGSTVVTGTYTSQLINMQTSDVGKFTFDLIPEGLENSQFITLELSRDNSNTDNYTGVFALLAVEIVPVMEV